MIKLNNISHIMTLKNIDGVNKKTYNSDIRITSPLKEDVFTKTTQETGQTMENKKPTQEEFDNKLLELLYDGIDEPEYVEEDVDSDSLPTCYIHKFYDRDDKLRKAVNESAGGLINDIRLYDEKERPIYISSYSYVGGKNLTDYYLINKTYFSYNTDGEETSRFRQQKFNHHDFSVIDL